jgi:hypothetical protein
MKTKLLLILLLITGYCYGQPGYLYRATKERLIATKTDSTFHTPAGMVPSLRGGSTQAGALFTDSVGGDSKGLYGYWDAEWHHFLDSVRLSTMFVPQTRTLTAGLGMSGGGDLSANRTFTLDTATVFPWVRATIPSSGGSISGYATGDTIYILGSGQSNAGGYNFGEIDTSANTKVEGWDAVSNVWRTLRRNNRPMGMYTPDQTWSAGGFDADKDSATNFTFYFAKRLQERTGKFVRVFLISYGGNSITNWIPAAATNFARITTEINSAGNPRIHYFLWCQGESDVALTDSAYKNKFDTLVQQLDVQTWFGKDVPIGIVSMNGVGGNLRKVRDWQAAMGSGIFDKRYFFIDGLGETSISDNVHYTATAHYNLGNKIIQQLINPARMQNNWLQTDSAGMGLFKTNTPNIGKGILLQHSTTKRQWYRDPIFFNTGTNTESVTLGATDAQVSRLVTNVLSDASANQPVFSIDHYINQNRNGRTQWIAGSTTLNGYFGWSTNVVGTESLKMTLNNAGTLAMLGSYTAAPAFTAGSFYNVQPFGVNNIFFGDNVTYNSGFSRVGTGMADFLYFTGGLGFGTAPNGSGAFTPTYRFLFNNDGTFGIGGTLTSVSNYAGALLQGNASSFVVNESGGDIDTRIEGDNDASLFVADGGTDKISIGTATVTAKLGVLSTSEQFRLQYDASNYFQSTTASTGSTTFNLVGTTPILTIADSLTLTAIAQNEADTINWKPLVIAGGGQVKKMNWAFAGGGMTNPLTTTGDIIYSSSGTTPARLGIGSNGQYLTVVSGVPAWTSISSTFSYGTYSPTVTEVTNGGGGSTVSTCQFMKVGTTVTVSGEITIDPLTTGLTEVRITLPVASALTAATQVGGTGHSALTGSTWQIQADATNDAALFSSNVISSAGNTLNFSFTYTVL